ncbi:FAD-dependent oxidoreductase [Nonomuraea phyllanthi]|uniref:FAD-dependent oxidoreductase n=1 Tax=Nonomuraea phyllanthi TaxID=2219224 RepID=A0A5C4WKD6_9ACTN|nr:FAD-dependent oxidoreductase [Nonomuraea phyllanthi]KAB8194465.1 FAD-dependent oxidoreductase [Nonomuraea phyllanthi]
MHVVVIGSGIVGAGAAYYLARKGAEVTVVDGGYPGEATGAGAGIVCPWVDHPEDDAWYRLTREGARHYPGLVEELGEDIGYAKVGALLVAEDPVDLEPVRALLRRRHPDAPEMGEITDVATPSELFPPLSDTLSALLVPGAARVDGCSVRDALLRAAVAQGARVRRGVATLTPGGQVVLHPLARKAVDERWNPEATEEERWSPQDVDEQRSREAAGQGPASHGVGAVGRADEAGVQDEGPASVGEEPAGLRQGPVGQSQGPAGQSDAPVGQGDGMAEQGGSWRQGAPLVPAAPPSSTATRAPRPEGDGEPIEADRVIVAAGAWTGEVCRPLGVELPVFPRRGQIVHATLEGVDTAWWPMVLPRVGPYLLGFPDSRVVVGATVEDVGFSPRVTMGGLAEVIEAGLRVAPGLFAATVTEARVGLRPVYAPGRALIGPVTGRVVVATGLSAYGLTAGPFTGELAAALALGEEPPIDITPYAPA